MNIIEINNLKKEYGKTNVLKGIDLHIKRNSFNVILGPSGSGKSTILNIMSCLEYPTSGTILFDSHDITLLNKKELKKFRRENCSYVFQKYALIPYLTAEENIKITSKKNYKINFDEICQLIEISDILDKFPNQLSGGQQQRIAIARAVLSDSKIIFCDEPTGALDSESSDKVKLLLKALQQKYNKTIVVVTHDTTFSDLSDKTIYVNDGLISKEEIHV